MIEVLSNNEILLQDLNMFFSRESDSTIANVRLSVCPSVTETPQPQRIMPSAIMLLSHHAPPLSLSEP